jgi:hypothetical protein
MFQGFAHPRPCIGCRTTADRIHDNKSEVILTVDEGLYVFGGFELFEAKVS